jgi:hypothetical protein
MGNCLNGGKNGYKKGVKTEKVGWGRLLRDFLLKNGLKTL